MLIFDPEIARAKVPALVVCGVDRNTRSAAIQQILATGGMRWAVISNEIEGPDFAAAATERVAGQMVPHAIGCLCCVTRSGLVSSLRKLFAMRSQGQVEFDQVLIETLPDADPAPVMQTLLNNALVTEYFCLDSVVTVLPASDAEVLRGSDYGFKQLALADRIVTPQGADTNHRLHRVNPIAPVLAPDHPDLSAVVLGGGLEARVLAGDLDSWLASPQYATTDGLEDSLHGFSIEFDEPLSWDAFHGWLNAGTQSNGDFMYRTKGAIRIAGCDGPVLINGAQHVYQPPHILNGAAVDRSRLLLITEEIDRAAVEASLRDDLPQFGRISEARAERAARVTLDPSIPL